MNFLDSSENDSKTKENLWAMLNSNDEQNIALATQVLWHIEIPEEWIAFLFSKKDSPAIQELLNFKFPREEFELAYQWFGLQDEVSRVRELDLLKKIVPLHKCFDWKYVLKLCVGKHSGHPYYMGNAYRYMDNYVDTRSVLFNDPDVPKVPLIESCLYNNYLDLYQSFIKELPAEIGMFPNITGISTRSDIYEIPFSIIHLNNLMSIKLGDEKEIDYKDLRINGLPFIEVLREHNPFLLVQLQIHKILDRYPPKIPSIMLMEIESLLELVSQVADIDKTFQYFLETLKHFYKEDYNQSLEKLKDLYENHHFYDNPIGQNLYHLTDIFSLKVEFWAFLVDFFEKNKLNDDRCYTYINLSMVFNHLRQKEYLKGYQLCKKCKNSLKEHLYRQIFVSLQVVFAVKLQNDDNLYNSFVEKCTEHSCDAWLVFEMGFTTLGEALIQMENDFVLESHRKNKKIAVLLEEFQHYTLTIENQ
jgi:hypothetical protein